MPQRRSRSGTRPKRQTLKDHGRALLAKHDLRGELILDGVRPRKGWWLVHRDRGRVYGRVEEVCRNGTIVMRTPIHPRVRIVGRTLVEGGYSWTRHAHLEGI